MNDDKTKARVKVRKLGLGDFTEAGAFYPCVDGKAVGENGRAFWQTRPEAMRVGMRFLTKLIEYEAANPSIQQSHRGNE